MRAELVTASTDELCQLATATSLFEMLVQGAIAPSICCLGRLFLKTRPSFLRHAAPYSSGVYHCSILKTSRKEGTGEGMLGLEQEKEINGN